jgi:hypothetical protein
MDGKPVLLFRGPLPPSFVARSTLVCADLRIVDIGWGRIIPAAVYSVIGIKRRKGELTTNVEADCDQDNGHSFCCYSQSEADHW